MKTIIILAAIVLCGSIHQAYAAPTSCYKGLEKYQPKKTQTTIILVDESTPRDSVSENDFRMEVAKLTDSPQHIVLLAYAGHTTGQALRLVDSWTIEAAISDQDVIQDIVFDTNKRHQSCIKKQHMQAKIGLADTVGNLFNTLPITTERSEIAYALGSVVRDFSKPNEAIRILHYSDGIQFSKGSVGRSFYGPNKQPRKIDPQIELKYLANDAVTAPRKRPDGGLISVLWWGGLVLPTPEKKGGRAPYLDSATITAFRTFWESYLTSLGASKVQIGMPNLLNPDLSVSGDKQN